MQAKPSLDRAAQAAQSVVAIFAQPSKAGGLLGFLQHRPEQTEAAIAARIWPKPTATDRTWHYWWQAHYIDALVDAGLRELGSSQSAAANFLATAQATLSGIWLRNSRRWTNDYYDDMAWLALASQRVNGLSQAVTDRHCDQAEAALNDLAPELFAAMSDEMGGGCYWSTKRDFKNAPATVPIALWLARSGKVAPARSLQKWLDQHLTDKDCGLIMDGMHWESGCAKIESQIYPYNQGTYLGLLLALGTDADRENATTLIANIAQHLQHDDTGMLAATGTGDGGLFTGILVRYLALAARDERLPSASRKQAADLVTATADALWQGSELRSFETGSHLVFSFNPALPAAETYPVGAPIELGTQIQAWTIMEAAATLQ